MQEQIRLLIDLQKVDAVIIDMKRLREEGPKKLTELRNGIESERTVLDKDLEDLKVMKVDKRTKEGFLETEIERVHRSEERLKEIKTQREYQALLKEVEQGKKLNSSREEDILKLTADIEDREKELAAREEALKTRETELAREQDVIGGELSRIDNEFEGKKKEWNDIADRVKPNILKMYQKVVEKRNAHSVVPVRNGACTGCHMGLPPQLYNQIQKGNEIYQCPKCHRIVYWEGHDS